MSTKQNHYKRTVTLRTTYVSDTGTYSWRRIRPWRGFIPRPLMNRRSACCPRPLGHSTSFRLFIRVYGLSTLLTDSSTAVVLAYLLSQTART